MQKLINLNPGKQHLNDLLRWRAKSHEQHVKWFDRLNLTRVKVPQMHRRILGLNQRNPAGKQRIFI